MMAAPRAVGTIAAPTTTAVAPTMMAASRANQFAGYGAISETVTETIVPERSFATVEKCVEIPEMVVRKQVVPEVVETIVEKKVKQIIQEVPEIQVQQVVEEVVVPQTQEVVKTVARPVIET